MLGEPWMDLTLDVRLDGYLQHIPEGREPGENKSRRRLIKVKYSEGRIASESWSSSINHIHTISIGSLSPPSPFFFSFLPFLPLSLS